MRDLAKRPPASHPSHLTQVLPHVFVFLEEFDPCLANLAVNSYPKPGGRCAWSQTAPGTPVTSTDWTPTRCPRSGWYGLYVNTICLLIRLKWERHFTHKWEPLPGIAGSNTFASELPNAATETLPKLCFQRVPVGKIFIISHIPNEL